MEIIRSHGGEVVRNLQHAALDRNQIKALTHTGLATGLMRLRQRQKRKEGKKDMIPTLSIPVRDLEFAHYLVH